MTTNPDERRVKFVCFWERLANSGVQEIHAQDMKAAEKLARECFGKFCKVTLYQVNGDGVSFGECK